MISFLLTLFKKNTLSIVLMVLFTIPTRALADASVVLQPQNSPIVGEPFTVDVLVEPDGEIINSADISLSFSPESYMFKGYQKEEGVMRIWVMPPAERDRGVVQFSGVIPGGVERMYDPMRPQEKGIPLVRLLFVPQKEGSASLSITNAMLLRNDGQGTEVPAQQGTIATNIAPARSTPGSIATDTIPPTQFSIEKVSGSALSRTGDFLVFDAIDTQSGIERYEVSFDGQSFTEATSPYVLPKRLFPYTLTARAVDFAGNYTDAAIFVPGAANIFHILVIALGGALAIVIYIRRKRQLHV